jgi:hypothetical protein
MKGFIYTALAVTGFIGCFAISTAHAQLAERLRFSTSFPFSIGNSHFPPGNYTVEPADDRDMGVLKISNDTKSALIVVIPEGIPHNKPADNELTFVRLGDHYVLEQIWDASDQSAMEPTLTAAELRQEPHNAVAERVAVPFTKIS